MAQGREEVPGKPSGGLPSTCGGNDGPSSADVKVPVPRGAKAIIGMPFPMCVRRVSCRGADLGGGRWTHLMVWPVGRRIRERGRRQRRQGISWRQRQCACGCRGEQVGRRRETRECPHTLRTTSYRVDEVPSGLGAAPEAGADLTGPHGALQWKPKRVWHQDKICKLLPRTLSPHTGLRLPLIKRFPHRVTCGNEVEKCSGTSSK